jgi:hypothetical protein
MHFPGDLGSRSGAEATKRPKRKSTTLGVLISVVVTGLFLIWPGATPWINDEALLLHNALDFASSGTQGLVGSLGVPYGPMAIWIYAGLLHLTHDPIRLVALRGALFLGTTFGAVLWLSALSTRLRPAAALLCLISPYLWIYSRQLWDNTFLIPLGAVAVAAYGAFTAAPSAVRLWLAILPLVMSILIHPMAIPLIMAIAAHALFVHREWLRRHPGTLAAQTIVCLLIAAPWLVALGRYLAHPQVQLVRPWAPAAVAPLPTPENTWWEPLLFPLLSGRLMSAQGVEYFLGPAWSHGTVARLAAVTWGAHLLMWIGLLMAVRRVHEGWRGTQPRDADFHVPAVLCLAFAINYGIGAATSRHTHPHYHNGVWICAAYFIALALSDPPGGPIGRSIIRGGGAAIVFAGAIVLGSVVLFVHRTGGTRTFHFGSILTTQVDVARKVGAMNPAAPLIADVPNMQMFPHALAVLRELVGLAPDFTASGGPVRIRYRDPRGSGWLVVEQLSP